MDRMFIYFLFALFLGGGNVYVYLKRRNSAREDYSKAAKYFLLLAFCAFLVAFYFLSIILGID